MNILKQLHNKMIVVHSNILLPIILMAQRHGI